MIKLPVRLRKGTGSKYIVVEIGKYRLALDLEASRFVILEL